MDVTKNKIQRRRIPAISWLLLFVVLVLAGSAIGKVLNRSNAEPKTQYINNVVEMLLNDGMAIHTTAPEDPPPLVRESVEIIFDDIELELTPPTFGRIEGNIHTFETLDNRDSWLALSRGFGGIAVMRGDELWVISVDSDLPQSRDVAERLAATINGEVK